MYSLSDYKRLIKSENVKNERKKEKILDNFTNLIKNFTNYIFIIFLDYEMQKYSKCIENVKILANLVINNFL